MKAADKALISIGLVAATALLGALFLGYGEGAFLRLAEYYRYCVEAFGSL